ncbi:MAG: sulfotransferase [Pseudomonadota bacterium]
MQKPDQLKAEISSIAGLLQSGAPDRAFKRATKAAKKWPNVAALPRLAGLSAVQQQNFKLAQSHFERAWQLEPGNPEIIQNYALSLVQAGDADLALKFLDKVGARSPLKPPQQFLRAMALLRERRGAVALSVINQVLTHQPGNVQAKCLKADILDELHRWDEALNVLKSLVKQNPKFQYGQLRLAKALASMGQFDDALIHARSALKLAPADPETLEFLAELPDLSSDDAAAVQSGILQVPDGSGGTNRENAAMAQFAAASLARTTKDVQQEMQHLARAHALLGSGFQDWEPRSQSDCRARLESPLPKSATHPHTDIARPIFVVGLPRSGTTLVERVLSAHSGVRGLGELASVGQWARKAEAQGKAAHDAQALADFYTDHLPELAEDTIAFVDKAPGNYAFLGVMAQAFPNAVILNVERDPRDIALSMWRAHFGAAGLYFTHDFKWMASEANRYRKYIQHWRTLLPGRIHDIRYETLVNTFRPTVEEIAQVCDLTFEDSMLSPHDTSDAIMTASSQQVRKPVNTGSVGRWRAFEDQLAPFVQGLDDTLWPEI